MRRFKEYISEKWLAADWLHTYHDGKQYYEVFKNPTMKELTPDVRGLIDSKGNLYVNSDPAVGIHLDLIKMLKLKHILKSNYKEFDVFNKYIDDFVAVQRKGNTNTFYLAESYKVTNNPRTTLTDENYNDINKVFKKATKKNHHLKFNSTKISQVKSYISEAKDLIITLPKNVKWSEYEKELAKAEQGEILNFKVNNIPKQTEKGCKCFLLYNGEVKGYMTICDLGHKTFKCTTTGKEWDGNFVQRTGKFNQIKPIQMKGFQGYRYFEDDYETI